MQIKSTTQMITELRNAALSVVAALERAKDMERMEQADAMRETSGVLIEMRRNADYLAQRLR